MNYKNGEKQIPFFVSEYNKQIEVLLIMNIIFNIYFFYFAIFVWIYLFNPEKFFKKNKKHFLTYGKMTKVSIHSSISTMKSTQLAKDHQKESNKRGFPESAGRCITW